MLRLLHTADWHIGHQLYGYDRTDEFLHFFDSLRRIAIERMPDALIVSGDIFDTPSPSAASLRLFNDALLSLRRLLPEMRIAVIAGNHDSASRLEAPARLWKRLDVDVIGSYDFNPADGQPVYSRCLVELKGKGVIAAAPYITRHSGTDGDRERRIFRALYEEASALAGELPTVLAAHIGITGGDMRGHRDTIGNLETVGLSALGEEWNYVALGHIHRPQNLNGHVRYSGSAIPVSFDEDYSHSVSFVTVPDKGEPTIEAIATDSLRRLETFPATPTEWEDALSLLTTDGPPEGCYLRLNVAYRAETPADLREQVVAALRGRDIRFCTIRFEYPGQDSGAQTVRHLADIDEFSAINPVDIAAGFLSAHGIPDHELPAYTDIIRSLRETDPGSPTP